MNTLHFIAKGSNYVNRLIESKPYIGNNFNLIIHTDAPKLVEKTFKNADIRKYNEPTFRYFDKYSLTYNITQEINEPVMYIDTGRIKSIFSTNMPYFDKSTIQKLYTFSNWGGVKSAFSLRSFSSPYFEDGYWDTILDYFEQEGLNLNKIHPLLERVFIFPTDGKMSTVIEALENVREIFERNSREKTHVYSGIGNGEGLALGYALTKTNTSYNLLKDVSILTNQPYTIL